MSSHWLHDEGLSGLSQRFGSTNWSSSLDLSLGHRLDYVFSDGDDDASSSLSKPSNPCPSTVAHSAIYFFTVAEANISPSV
ncbi:unnamed protein product [Protopolystoma xenopodis]|uniref:Uncharacterized protein n=1 Tax=Protopolystoma xenopodis TaxID=117903 RepID=A0A3S5B771_9PLAT|nr:unnamed protein product [Protopolystoma xenopodis]